MSALSPTSTETSSPLKMFDSEDVKGSIEKEGHLLDTAPVVEKRPVNTFEKSLTAFKIVFSGLLKVNASTTTSISEGESISGTAMRRACVQAIDLLSYRHPYLRTVLSEDLSEWLPRGTSTNSDLLEFKTVTDVLDESFVEESLNRHTRTHRDFTRGLFYVSVVYDSTRIAVTMSLCHGCADGRSGLICFNDFVQYLSLVLNDPCFPPPPPLPIRNMIELLKDWDVYVPIPDDQRIQWTEDDTPHHRQLMKGLDATGPTGSDAADGAFQAVFGRLSQEEFVNLKSKLNQHCNGSLQPAVSFVANMCVLKRHLQDKTIEDMTTVEGVAMCAAQLRRHLNPIPTPVEEDEIIVGGACFWLNFPFNPTDRVLDILKSSRASMKSQISSTELLQFLSGVSQSLPPLPYSIYASFLGASHYASTYPKENHPSTRSLPQLLTTLSLERSLFSGGANFPFSAAGIASHCFTVNGALEISVACCRPAYTDECATHVLNDMIKGLKLIAEADESITTADFLKNLE